MGLLFVPTALTASCRPLRPPTAARCHRSRRRLQVTAVASVAAGDGTLPPGLRYNDNLQRLLEVRATTRADTADHEVDPMDKLTARKAEGTLTRLAGFIRKAASEDATIWARVAAAIVVMVASKCLNILTPWLFKRALDTLGSGATQERSRRLVFQLLVGFGVSRAAASFLHESRNAVFANAGQALGRMVTKSSFTHLQSLDTAFHAQRRTGLLVGIVDRGTKSVLSIFRSLLFSFAPSIFELVLVCAVLMRSFSPIFLVTTMATFLTFVALTVRLNRLMATTRKFMNAVDKEGNAKLTDSFFNMDTVKFFGNEKFELLRYDACLKEYQKEAVRNDYEYALLNFGQGIVFTVGLSLTLLLAARNVIAGSMTVGDLVMTSSLLQQLWVPLSFLGWQYRELKQSIIHMDDLFDLLDAQPAIQDAPEAKSLSLKGGEIEFKDIGFSYTADTGPVIKELSFKVPAGKTLAIVGESGSGKSTSIKLLYRLYSPTRGKILIDGQDISTVTQESLRRAIGIIPQDTALFNDTIHYNIAYGKPDASREEVVAASRAAAIHDTISRMPEGYDTVVGDKGVRLSGGERQRVAIARCILKSPSVLVCDEATSALDSKTEEEITLSLRSVQKQRTSIVIAHRLSTVVDADEILVMKRGIVVERGSHGELIADPCSEYSRMWARQQKDKKTKRTENSCEEFDSEASAGHNAWMNGNGHSEDGLIQDLPDRHEMNGADGRDARVNMERSANQ